MKIYVPICTLNINICVCMKLVTIPPYKVADTKKCNSFYISSYWVRDWHISQFFEATSRILISQISHTATPDAHWKLLSNKSAELHKWYTRVKRAHWQWRNHIFMSYRRDVFFSNKADYYALIFQCGGFFLPIGI